ncbi:MAG: Fe(3+) dicitrate transport protein, partial [Ulvibacter sp.]
MKHLTHYLVVPFLLIFTAVQAQFTISGTVISEDTKKPIANTEIYNTTLSTSVKTNDLGVFKFENLPTGTYTFVVFSFEYEVVEIIKEILENTNLTFVLPVLGETLSEVLITKRKERIFALRKLREVEGTAI